MARTALQALAELRAAAGDGRLATLCARYGLDLVTAFGSAVRPHDDPGQRPPGDLDVGVRAAPPGAVDLLRVVPALVELLGYDDVDVMDLGRAGVVARSRACRRVPGAAGPPVGPRTRKRPRTLRP